MNPPALARSEVGVLLSMTGYGEAHYQSDGLTLAIELRAVNNRYLKVTLRAPEPYNLLEPEFEKVIRRTIRRGTIQVHLRCERQYAPQDFRINAIALRSYLGPAARMEASWASAQTAAKPCSGPGAGPAGRRARAGQRAVHAGRGMADRRAGAGSKRCRSLQAMRQEEGRAMAQELLHHRDHIAGQLDEHSAAGAGVVVDAYRDRLLERVRGLLGELDVKIDRSDLIKEVSIFAERSDIAEEVVRLASHLDQFQEIMNEPESPAASWSS